jgi:NADH:ubiquinone oxidoreductase subunit 4 (subunit M)
VSGAMFFCVGVIYERYHVRSLKYFGGLANVYPLFAIVFLIFSLANISFPGTSSFVGEFLILVGSFKVNTTITFLGATGVIIGGAYSLWLFNRIAYGNIKTQYTQHFLDLSPREFITFFPLILGTIIMGIYPTIFLSFMHMSVNNLIEAIYF